MAKQKKDFGLIVWLVGRLLTVLTSMRKTNGHFSVPFEAYERLGSPEGEETLEKVIRLIHEEWLAGQPKTKQPAPLLANHHCVRVTYAPMPSMDDLKKEWGKDNVSVIFGGRPFTLHASCVGMDRTPGEKVFCLHDTGIDDWESEAEIGKALERRDQFASNGRRPATEEETYEFAMAHPELADFVGLGSFAMHGGYRLVAGVWQRGSQRVLGSYWVGDRFRRRIRVLLVSK